MGGPARRRHRGGPRVKARWLVATLAVGIAALALLGVQLGGTGSSAARPDPVTGDAIADRLASVSPTVFHTIGTGSAVSYPLQVDTPPLRDGGRPTVLFMGAEYCPYCAAERWALVLALSRFGRFSGLHLIRSAVDDDYPDTQTFTFHGASYRSTYVTFEAVEMATNRRVGGSYAPLDTPTPAERTLMTTYDGPPYFAPSSTGGIPFLDFGGQYPVAGASYDPAVLHGMTPDAIATAVSDPSSAVARGVVGSANALTSALCGVTHDAPADVCTDPAIVAIRPKLR